MLNAKCVPCATAFILDDDDNFVGQITIIVEFEL